MANKKGWFSWNRCLQ